MSITIHGVAFKMKVVKAGKMQYSEVDVKKLAGKIYRATYGVVKEFSAVSELPNFTADIMNYEQLKEGLAAWFEKWNKESIERLNKKQSLAIEQFTKELGIEVEENGGMFPANVKSGMAE